MRARLDLTFTVTTSGRLAVRIQAEYESGEDGGCDCGVS